MKKQFSLLSVITLLTLVSLTFSACVKQEYDQPVTANVDPNLTANLTLADLRALAASSTPIEITADVIIAGIVTADDESGSFYKEMVIQDSTAALSVLLDLSNFNAHYPIGRRIFIKCQGLYVATDQDGNVELGARDATQIGRIPAGAIQQYLYPGQWGLDLPFVDVSLATLNAAVNNNSSDYTQKLVRINPAEMVLADAGTAWGGDPNTTSDNDRLVKDCGNNTVVVYTSSYANFATQLTPSGNGPIQGIFKVYGGAGELVLRDASDAAGMTGLRCDSLNLNPTQISIDSLRTYYTGTTTTAPLGRFIKGIVISDFVNGNWSTGNMIIQDGASGIAVRFTTSTGAGTAHSFMPGDEVTVNVSGQELSEYNGLLQVNKVPLGNAVKVGTGTVTPRVTTIADAIANFDAWESTLVTYQGVTITGGTTPGQYSGSTTLSDATGNMIMYTRSAATFSGNTYPTGAVNVTGVLSEYSTSTAGFTPQLVIRNPTDVQ